MATDGTTTVRAAVAAQDAADAALRARLAPDTEVLLEALLDAVEGRVTATRDHLVDSLAGYFPAFGPAIRELADLLIYRTQV